MSEILKHYGGLIVATIVASFLVVFFGFAKNSCSKALDDNVLTNPSYNQKYEDINDIVVIEPPEIETYDEFIIESNENFDPTAVIINAYGQESGFDIYELTDEEAESISTIKQSIKPGKVNVAYPENFKNNVPGTYEVKFYVKNSTSDGLWSHSVCNVVIEEYIGIEE